MRSPSLAIVLGAIFFVGKVLANTNHAAIMAAKEVEDQAMFPGRPIFIPSWNLPLEPGNWDKTSTYNGTLQHAMQQMDEAHPGWTAKYEAWAKTQPGKPSTPNLVKREGTDCKDDQWTADIRCYEDFSAGPWDAAGGNAVYLRNLGGYSKMRAGPNACGRVACQWDTAVFTCNQNDHSIETSWKEAGNGADCVNQKCFFWSGDQFRVKGHTFSNKDSWDVIVRGLERDDKNPADRKC